MKKENKSFEYEVYASVNELSEDDKNLMNEAKKALDKSYSPYSNFKVGAAVRLRDAHILSGAIWRMLLTQCVSVPRALYSQV